MFPRVAQLRTATALRQRLADLGCPLPVDDAPLSAAEGSPLAAPLSLGLLRAGNRWCIHPMEGWDALPDGSPSEATLRRWRRFGHSGAKLIWGGEAAAIVPEGRANPNQTLATPDNAGGLQRLLRALEEAHRERFGSTDDLVVGLQLTHSGRYCRPTPGKPAPRIACHHPLLDSRVGVAAEDDSAILSDAELEDLIGRFVAAAKLARDVGFQFVDVKACHGYLLHELLGARRRPGKYGGDLAGRTRLLCEIIAAIQRDVPGLAIGVRLSAFDTIPFGPLDGGDDDSGGALGVPLSHEGLVPYHWGFGVWADDPTQFDLTEPIALVRQLEALHVVAVNVTGGSPYYNPHVQRPALFPPSDGYPPPEDPLVGVWRHIDVARQIKAAAPSMQLVGTGYTYLQEFLPHVAQAVLRSGWIDAVGLGRMVLSYPELPADALTGRTLARKRLCRTFSDCTTGPRRGLPSGCYPLDEHYTQSADGARLRSLKQKDRPNEGDEVS